MLSLTGEQRRNKMSRKVMNCEAFAKFLAFLKIREEAYKEVGLDMDNPDFELLSNEQRKNLSEKLGGWLKAENFKRIKPISARRHLQTCLDCQVGFLETMKGLGHPVASEIYTHRQDFTTPALKQALGALLRIEIDKFYGKGRSS